MDRPAYQEDPYRIELDTEVIEVGEDDGRPWAVTADTLFFPEGGGQPADHGIMGPARVIDVQKRDGRIVHHLAEPIHPGPVHQRLDWARRYDHMQQHTGQHLLTAVADVYFDLATTAFHLGSEVCDIELETEDLRDSRMRELEDAVAQEIRAARPISAQLLDDHGDLDNDVRSRGLPRDLDGPIRMVEIEGLDRNTCGGTHVASSAEVGSLALLSTERLRGGTRLYFVAGDRVRRRLAAWEARGAALRSALGAPNDELVEVAEAKLEQIKILNRQLRKRTEDLAVAVADVLGNVPRRVITRHYEDGDLDFLRLVAIRLNRLRPAGVALLTGSGSEDGVFVVAVGPESGIDAVMAGDTIRMAFGGSGGGGKGIYQGTAPNLDRRDTVFEGFEALLGLG
jgi:Ser-tRNA(Ala) deacylase AlaX